MIPTDPWWVGFITGALIGAPLGMLVMGVAAMSRLDPDEERGEAPFNPDCERDQTKHDRRYRRPH